MRRNTDDITRAFSIVVHGCKKACNAWFEKSLDVSLHVFLKLVSAIFYQIFIFSSNGRPSKQALKKYYFYYDYDYDYYNH